MRFIARLIGQVIGGATVFWVPDIIIHLLLYRGGVEDTYGWAALLVTPILPIITLKTLMAVARSSRGGSSAKSMAWYALLGIWLCGPAFLTVSFAASGGQGSASEDVPFILIGTVLFPFFTFALAGFDGSLLALLLTTGLLIWKRRRLADR